MSVRTRTTGPVAVLEHADHAELAHAGGDLAPAFFSSAAIRFDVSTSCLR